MKMLRRSICTLLTAILIFSLAVVPITASGDNFEKLGFKDVKSTDWFAEGVYFATVYGISNGVTSDTFAPQLHLNRAMAVTMLYRFAGKPEAPNSPDKFADVPSSAWYSDAVQWASQYGIVRGISDTKFAPENDIKRSDFATIMIRFAAIIGCALPELNDVGIERFRDASDIPDYAALPVDALSRADIVNGKTDRDFLPNDILTRAEGVTVFYRFFISAVSGKTVEILKNHSLSVNELGISLDDGSEASYMMVDLSSNDNNNLPDNIEISAEMTGNGNRKIVDFTMHPTDSILKQYGNFTLDSELSEGEILRIRLKFTISGTSETVTIFSMVVFI